MTHERAPERVASLVGDTSQTSPWDMAHDRLANPESPRTSWLATTRPDGAPHLMPLIAFWIDGALYIVVSEESRKARNLLDDGRCVVGTGSTRLPSIDLVVEGNAEPVTDVAALRPVVDYLVEHGWPLELRGTRVHGPNAPTAGPPPYTIFRIVPSTIFGLPGMYGMEQFDPADLPKPTRWEFAKG